MNQPDLRRRLILAAVVCLTCGLYAVADEPTLTKEQMKQFLLNAKIVKSKDAKKGVTHTYRLTLSDGTLTHDASFQPIDEHKREMKLANGTTELNFVDSYKYNIAAPDPDAWNSQMYKIRVFDQLVSDADPNLTNVLIGENWQIWRIDF